MDQNKPFFVSFWLRGNSDSVIYSFLDSQGVLAMIKKLVQDEEISSRQEPLIRAKQILKKLYPCFVLITCTEPQKDGEMQVEMDFEGDEDLASMITEHATQVFDGRNSVQNSNKG